MSTDRFGLILFDLDGTLIRTEAGILHALKEAFGGLGHPVPTDRVLLEFIGPRLDDSLRRFTDLPEEAVAPFIRRFRDCYREHGIGMSEPYPGIPEVLDALHGTVPLGVATAKPETSARRVLEVNGILDRFAVVRGARPEEGLLDKWDIMASAMAEFPEVPPQQVLMVGDRVFDVEGARRCHTAILAVTYGYGDPAELEDAAARTDSPAGILEFWRGPDGTRPGSPDA